MDKPNISPDFTIDDIRKIREWSYGRRKSMSNDEHIADIEKGAAVVRKEIERIRKENYSH